MRPPEIEILEEMLDDDAVTPSDLGLPIDLTRADLEDDDDVRFRTLFENPEPIIRPRRWPSAA
jgi:hypothetical protein